MDMKFAFRLISWIVPSALSNSLDILAHKITMILDNQEISDMLTSFK
jgi:hypothetical protein